jgi:hypothetical protein
MLRTDTRSLLERKHSVTLRITEIRRALNEAERCLAEIETEIENEERRREAGSHVAAE